MSIETNKTIVRRYFEEGWNQNQVADLEEYIAPTWIHHSGTGIWSHGPGPEREVMRSWRAAIPDFHYQIEALIAEDDLVVARTIFVGTLMGRLAFETLTLPPSDKPMRVAETVIFRIADGKIVESWATWDRLSLLQQLGMWPTP
jgi:predicted ester cyclase